ncbi:cell envelope transcriptional attenuator family protein [Gottschalkia purinilytica]|uniref:Cell envelope transcriptional attenuator family protein n=1 Tax=Gottschalkia purinilytica TaxID=1503 RepID=A0A0L0W8M1_GOTPU|nr:LCP family protein [Gottschalkia purinilytica]KNF07797.1 cell envelope transcriptional attenuator family protein [Gottschalkia purinilytica]
MKYFFKIFVVAFILFTFVIGIGAGVYYRTHSKMEKESTLSEEELNKIKDPLERAIKTKGNKVVNALLLGMDGSRTDTIMFGSFDTENKKLHIISIPRDTYYYRKGYGYADQRKINAVYGAEKIEGVKSAIKDILGTDISIDYYAMIDYKGVEKIVDSVGGVEVDVPFDMEYFDPTDKPPLRINIPKGRQTLNGKKAIEFLRFRHNNDYTVGYKEGDIGRIKAQQQFVSSFIKKSLSIKLPKVISTALDNVETDIKLKDALYYGPEAIGIGSESITMTTLPGASEDRRYGKSKLSYFIHNPKEVRRLMMEVYSVNE